MAQNHDYIPWNDDELLVYVRNLYADALGNFERWQVTSGKGRHAVTALNPRTGSKQKPPFVKGVAFAHRVRGAEVYGKVADYACAYENEGGKRGPWSDVVSLLIS